MNNTEPNKLADQIRETSFAAHTYFKNGFWRRFMKIHFATA